LQQIDNELDKRINKQNYFIVKQFVLSKQRKTTYPAY